MVWFSDNHYKKCRQKQIFIVNLAEAWYIIFNRMISDVEKEVALCAESVIKTG